MLDTYARVSSQPSIKGAETLKAGMYSLSSSYQTCSHSRGPAGKCRRLSLVILPLFKVCNATLAHNEKKYPDPGLYVDFAGKEKTAQLNNLLTEDGLRGMMVEKTTVLLITCFQLKHRSLIEAFALWRDAT